MKRTDARLTGKDYIERVGPIIFPIYGLLESGSQLAYKFIDSTGAKAINKYLFSDIVRDHVCRNLDELKRSGTIDFFRAYKANSGIEVFFDALRIKVLRPGIDEDGDATLPPPKSGQQELFYMGNYLPWDDSHVIISNLVMLWESDHFLRSTSAWLACPDEGKETLFCEPVPHPATKVAPPPPITPTDDLDYERADADEQKPKTGEEEGEDE